MADIEMIKVESSNIESVGHLNEDLMVEYKGGTKYIYRKVPKETFDRLLESESKGRFINSEIKGKFDYEKYVEVQETSEN